jgi:hypothetical protein
MRFVAAVLVAALGQTAALAGQDMPGAQTQPPLLSEQAPRNLAHVFVQPADGGDEVKGQLVGLGPKTLELLVDGRRISLPLENVRRIESPGDSVKNGAVIGAMIGGLWCALVCGQGLDRPGDWPTAVALAAAFWGVAGAGIDAMIPGRTTIYRKPSAKLGVGGGTRAVVSFRFRF